MVAALGCTLWKKDFGRLHAPKLDARSQRLVGIAIGAVIGFYDGYFGPGSFLIFAFVGLFGFSLLVASASAKAVNTITNLAALAWFLSSRNVIYARAVPMAAFNVAGSLLGSRLAIADASGFVRVLFNVMVTALIAHFGLDIARG